MPLVGIHYKVVWHFKGTSEVASANLNVYDKYEERTFMEDSMIKLNQEVEKFYPSARYNSRVEIKAMNINHDPVPVGNLPIIKIGEQEVIDLYLEDLISS
jgi:hypothetical protein